MGELTDIQQAWLEALPAYLEMKACQLGLCGKQEALEMIAKTSPDEAKRKRAQMELESLRYEVQAKWVAAVRRVEHLYIASQVR